MTSPQSPPYSTARAIMRIVMAALFTTAGIAHVATPDPFLAITPDWVPFPREVIIVTGICEIAGSIALLTPRLRWLAGVMFALYALCVWPANFKHAFKHIALPPVPDSWWYHGPRLALQPVIIWWALFCAGVIDWPFGPASPVRLQDESLRQSAVALPPRTLAASVHAPHHRDR